MISVDALDWSQSRLAYEADALDSLAEDADDEENPSAARQYRRDARRLREIAASPKVARVSL